MMKRFLAILAASLALAPAADAEFRASAVKVDITPQTPQWLLGYAPRKSTGVHDRIWNRVLLMDDGRSQFVLASTEICIFSPALYDEVADALAKTGIPRTHFWWTVTHTHSAPEVGTPGVYLALLNGRPYPEWDREYTGRVRSSLLQAVRDARAKLEPARIATGAGMAMANINRRARDADGKISLGLNPEGPVDRQLELVRLTRPDGSLIALAVNYAMHGTVLGGKYDQISGDGPGVVSAYVEEKLGAPVLYINGAAGDIAPIYSVYDTPSAGHLSQFRVLLGDRILEANRLLPPGSADVTLRAGEMIVETPLKANFPWPDEVARHVRRDGGRVLVRLPLRFLRFGDVAVWALPVELFSEIAVRVRSQSPFLHTFYFGYTNGWFGYLPTATGFAEGGYEANTSPFTPQAEGDVTRAVVTLFQAAR